MTSSPDPIRVLVAAHHPIRASDFRLDELVVDGGSPIEVVQFVRRLGPLTELATTLEADVIVIDTSYPDGAAFEAITEVRQFVPTVSVLALTASPAPHSEVALAIRAGAAGFVEVDDEPEHFVRAIRTVHDGQPWLPPTETQAVLTQVADDLDITTAERRSRLTGVALGLIPAVGIISAIMSLLWRRYLGHIGVRPVDLAIDPTTRVVDVLAALSFVLGVFGPFLLVKTWIDLLSDYTGDRPGLSWITAKRRRATVVVTLLLIAALAALIVVADLVVIVFVGPMAAIAILAAALDLESELPPFLRISNLHPKRFLTIAGATTFLFLAVLSTEVMVTGPDLQPGGADGHLAHRVLGFRAQPSLVYDVSGDRPPRELLYLGGNADLYIFVDPCNDDLVEYVSVGSSRLEIIDVVSCS